MKVIWGWSQEKFLKIGNQFCKRDFVGLGTEQPVLREQSFQPLFPDASNYCRVGHSVVHYLIRDRSMIVNFRDDWLRQFFVNDVRSKKIASDLEDRLFRKIQMIDDATTDRDLRSPPSNHFEKLQGHLEGLHSIRVNKRWRLVFRWNGSRGEVKDLYLDDHSYD
jgi:toxin HigB-1